MSTPTVKIIAQLGDIFPAEQISERFRKRTFWLNEYRPTDPRYENTWEVELHNDDCDRIDAFLPTQLVEVEVEVRGRRYTGQAWGREGSRPKVFITLKCIGIRLADAPPVKAEPPRYQDRPARRDSGPNPRTRHFPPRH